MDVTVLTPTVDGREQLLGECRASVAAQTVPAGHAVGLDFERHGPAVTRNALLAAVTSPWVGFLDDDDLIDPGHVETLLAASDSADVVIPHCRFAGRVIPPKFCNREYDRAVLRRHGIFPITVLARTSALLAAGGFPVGARYEDWSMWNAMADAGAVFRVVPIVTWTYRLDGAGHRTDAA